MPSASRKGTEKPPEARCRSLGPACRISRGAERRCRDHFDWVWIHLEEFLHHDIRIEAYRMRVGPDERSAENPRRPMRNVVALECIEQRLLDLGALGDRGQSNLLFFTPPAQSRAETVRHAAPQKSSVASRESRVA